MSSQCRRSRPGGHRTPRNGIAMDRRDAAPRRSDSACGSPGAPPRTPGYFGKEETP
jgi:hypothetical protein